MATQTRTTNDILLRRALRGNGLFSAFSGLLFVLASAPVAAFLGIEEASILGLFDGGAFIFIVGSGLLGFAGSLFLNALRDEIDRVQAALAIVMDIGWVVFSAIVLITGALPFSTAGGWAVLIVADGVTVFAILQVVGLRRMGER